MCAALFNIVTEEHQYGGIQKEIIDIRRGVYVQSAGKHRWVSSLKTVLFQGFILPYGFVGLSIYLIRNDYVNLIMQAYLIVMCCLFATNQIGVKRALEKNLSDADIRPDAHGRFRF